MLIFSNSLWESVNFRSQGNGNVFTDCTKYHRQVIQKSLSSSNTQASESSQSLREAVHENKKK